MRTLSIVLASGALVTGLVLPVAAGASTEVPGASVSGATTHIHFDLGDHHCSFTETKPLSEEYASLGVHFQGPSETEGGAVLDQCGRFGVHARSGQEFLAFNAATYARWPETITFDMPVTRVACYVANGSREQATYRLIAMRAGHVVTRTTVVAQASGYTGIAVKAHLGIDSVIVQASVPDQSFVLDDLSFTALG